MKSFATLITSLTLSAALILPVSSFASGAGQRPGNSRQTTHRNNSQGNNNNRPANRPNNNRPTNRPDNNRPSNRPGNSNNNRPGAGHGNVRPGNPSHPGSSVRPGTPVRPGHPGPSVSAPRPGTPVYAPLRYPSRPAWDRPLPPRPPRRVIVPSAPVIPSILGISFGSMINSGISLLSQGGYNILGYASDAVYLSNVFQFGFDWPTVTIYYGNNGMSNARFQYSSLLPGLSRFNSVYSQLSTRYGRPVSNSWTNGVNTVVWAGGNGYVSLVYGPAYDQFGNTAYYTDIIFGN